MPSKLEFTFSRCCKGKIKSFIKNRRRNKEIESKYAEFKEGTAVRILLGFSIVLVLISLTIAIIGIVKNEDIPLRVVIFFVSCLALLARKFSIIVWKLLVCGSWTALLYVLVNFTENYTDTDPPGSYFVLGNALGMAEFMIILSLKDMILKIPFIIINCLVKVLTFQGHFNAESSILFGVVFVLTVAFYIYYDFLERKNFKAFYDSREELRKFQLLLSKDFPTSVMVIASDLQSELYSNNFFKHKFNIEGVPVLPFFRRFKTNSGFQSEDSDLSDKETPNLAEVIMKFAAEVDISHQKEEGDIIFASFEKTPQTKFHFEIRLRKVLWDLKPAYALVFNDISDKQILMTMKYADQQKDRVISTLSHELKTPINGILGLLRMVKARVTDQLSLTYLAYGESCGNLLLNFVNSILELSQMREGKPKIVKTSFNLNEFLNEIKSLFLFQAEQRNINFSIEKDASVPDIIYTDKHRLTMILITLLGNAFKFTFKGSITLKLAPEQSDPEYLKFSIADTGVGIKDQDKAILFKMFGSMSRHSARDNSHGAGLGLTVSNELLKALNNDSCSLRFESVYGIGTTFYFSIKAREQPQIEESLDMTLKNTEVDEIVTETDLVSKKIHSMQSYKEEYHFLGTHQNLETKDYSLGNVNLATEAPDNERDFPKNILVVDDNPFNILAVCFILEKFKCKVSKACNGEECLKILDESICKREHFDLILMDIQMPILDGVETTKIIKGKIEEGTTYSVPIIALTANKVDGGEKERYLESGMVECLSKPLKETELCRVLKELGIKGQ